MLRTTSVAGPAASAEVQDKNPEQNNKEIQVENWDEKELVQKSCKSQPKGQQMAKSKKWIQAKKVEAFRAKSRASQSESFFIS